VRRYTGRLPGDKFPYQKRQASQQNG
jgi:hypothetical protein